MQKVQITSPGIKKALRRYDYSKSIAEYIWNGFDANASKIVIDVTANTLDNISKITIADNGYGIPFDDLKTKFIPFFESEKEVDPTVHRATSAVHGKNGVGRLTFFNFASQATWETTYIVDGQAYSYKITIDAENLHTYSTTEPQLTQSTPGTTVSFEGIHTITFYNFETDIKDYLAREFGWFLELNLSKNYKIIINGAQLDYFDIVGEKENFSHNSGGFTFDIRYIRWRVNLNKEYSRYYYINSKKEEIGKETTTLNNKGDHFYHSVYIQSSYFDDFSIKESQNQPTLMGHTKSDATFRELMEFVNRILHNKRKPFLRKYTDQLIADFEQDDAFPKFNDNEWDKYRRKELEEVIRELYLVEPKIFSRLNIEQKKTFAYFLNLIIDSGEKDKLFNILQEIVDLESSEREELAEILRTTKLSGIIKTIKLIEDRYRAIEQLQNLVFRTELKANEIRHIQKFVEKHYWIFGEQYHLVTAAEPKFEKALKRYIYLLEGKTKEDIHIDHPDRNKEMDIFMVRQLLQNNTVHNVVVELKHPKIRLGEKELSQVKRYMRVILSQPEFNGKKHFWEFYLVGNQLDTHGYMEGEMESHKQHGERSLVYSRDNHKIYAKTWSDIFADFEIRHKFLYEKLKLKREQLIEKSVSADHVIQKIRKNSAVQPPEISLPSD